MNLPIQQNKIVFVNFKGSSYGCNPKYITEEILNRHINADIVWLVTKDVNKKDLPKSVRVIDFKSKNALRELSTAKIWVDNQRKLFHIKLGLQKKNEQVYIQTWHGSLGIKKIGQVCPNTKKYNAWVPNGKFDAKMTDIILSNSTFEDEVFYDNFWGNGKIKQFGHPRNDIFFWSDNKKKQLKDKIFAKFNIDPNKKILLYAPSYRDSGDLDCYNLKVNDLLKILNSKTQQEWVIMVRMHPNLSKIAPTLFKIDNKKIVDVSQYPDIQELLVSSDIAMTDYSSCIFDFMLSRKPAFIFATDIEKYNTDRGFYYPLETTPFPLARNNEELIENIKNFDEQKYKEDVEQFLKDKGCMEDGHASERVVDLIVEIIND